ncbi:MAG: HDOD domain-containing protein [Idiomarina sp.]
MFFYVARQPILNRDKTLFAYELLFRDGMNNAFPNISADEATSKLVESSQFSSGIDDLTGGKLAFINFAEDAIINQLPTLLPNETVVVEVLETVTPNKNLVHALTTLKAKGYTIALDDFIYDEAWKLVFPHVDIIKIDIQISGLSEINELRRKLKDYSFKYLAEKVETYEEFQLGSTLGFDYFQGYFFSKPEVIQKRALNPSQLAFADLLFETSKLDMDVNKVCASIERDVGLSYKLLRFVNSSAFHRSRKIENLKQAIVFLGQQELQKLVAVIAAAQLSDNKPSELMRLSITRARFCEHLAVLYGRKDDAPKAFLTGLMSLIDAIMDDELKNILDRIPLSQDIYDALIDKRGVLAYLLALAVSYENANWARTAQIAKKLKISEAELPDLYLDATSWANAYSEFDEEE